MCNFIAACCVFFLLVQFGDVHPGRSCRLRKPDDEYDYSKSLARASGHSSSKGAIGGGVGEAEAEGQGDGWGAEGWSLFDWADGTGTRGYEDDEEYDDSDDGGAWATPSRV